MTSSASSTSPAPVVADAANRDLWLEILRRIEPKIPRSQFITWFKDTTILGRDNATVVVGLPLPMFLNWHLEHYRMMTLDALREVDPTIDQIVYQVDNGLKDDLLRTLRLLEHFPALCRFGIQKSVSFTLGNNMMSR